MVPVVHAGFVASPLVRPKRHAQARALVCRQRTRQATVRMVSLDSIADRSYQLEEMEDEASATSALYLHANGTVAHGRTDGPQPTKVNGTWEYNESEKEIRLDLDRHFRDSRIEFSVQRVFRGHLDCSEAFDFAVFAGNIYPDSETVDARSAVGHFSLIDASSDLPDEKYDATQP
jgi:hypothetical protein